MCVWPRGCSLRALRLDCTRWRTLPHNHLHLTLPSTFNTLAHTHPHYYTRPQDRLNGRVSGSSSSSGSSSGSDSSEAMANFSVAIKRLVPRGSAFRAFPIAFNHVSPSRAWCTLLASPAAREILEVRLRGVCGCVCGGGGGAREGARGLLYRALVVGKRAPALALNYAHLTHIFPLPAACPLPRCRRPATQTQPSPASPCACK